MNNKISKANTTCPRKSFFIKDVRKTDLKRFNFKRVFLYHVRYMSIIISWLYKFLRKIESLNRAYLFVYLIIMNLIDIVITSHVYTMFPVLFFKYESNVVLILFTQNFCFLWAILYMFFFDLFLGLLLIFPYKSLRVFVFVKASLHFLGFNWIVIIWYNGIPFFISLINYIVSTLALGFIVYSLATDQQLFEDLEKFLINLTKREKCES